MNENNVILIGGIHHNGLNLARMFGENGINVDLICVGAEEQNYLSKSRYVRRSECFTTNSQAFDYILKYYDTSKENCILFPYSDGAAYELDSRLEQFKGFICPSIRGIQGEIVKLMDKDAQYSFAKEHGIRMAESKTINLESFDRKGLQHYPYILKPLVSAKGDKGDIVVCYDEEELTAAVASLLDRSYTMCLLQEYLKLDYEALIVGAIYKSSRNSDFVVHRVIRQWPEKTGSGSYDEILTDANIIKECDRIVSLVKNIGYVGLIDIEILVVNGEVYLNEINWRNSGGGYRSMSNGFYYPFWFYLDILGKDVKNDAIIKNGSTSMAEMPDFYNVLRRNVTLIEWIRQYKNSDNYALRRKNDMAPVRSIYIRSCTRNIVKLIMVYLRLKKY